MVHFVNNSVALVVLLIQGAIYCWQVVLLGLIGILAMMGVMLLFGRRSHKKGNKISQLDGSANVRGIISFQRNRMLLLDIS